MSVLFFIVLLFIIFFLLYLYFILFFFFFFFSSRRRHTRYIGDWSSDVCSSDLPLFHQDVAEIIIGLCVTGIDFESFSEIGNCLIRLPLFHQDVAETIVRSEERRVGKEWRWRCTEAC